MENFRADVEVAVNDVFYSWVFGFKGKVQIKAPKDVKDGYCKMVADTYKNLMCNTLEGTQTCKETPEDDD